MRRPTATGARLRGAPIALQIFGLLVAALVVAQAFNLAVILLAPPQRPPIYRLEEIAGALEGRSLASRFGRPMERMPGAPPPVRPGQFEHETRDLAALLKVSPDRVRLQVEGGWMQNAVWRGFAPGGGRRAPDGPGGPGGGGGPGGAPPDWRQGGPPPDDGRGGPPPQPPPDQPRSDQTPSDQTPSGQAPSQPVTGQGQAAEGQAPGGAAPGASANRAPPRGGPFFEPGPRPVFGDFVAALQQPSGAWLVVRSKPEPFPNSWQSRIILWFCACLAVFSLAGLGFARRMTAPIADFAAAAERLGRDPRAPPMTLKGPAELGVAARAFNEMQVRIKRYVEDRTAMVGAISHDLRTPLMRIRFRMESAPPALRDGVLQDVGQMEAMIAAVLAFIRDANAPANRERLDLLSLLECEVDAAALVGGDVTMAETDPVPVLADSVALRRLFANLIENAVRYGQCARVSLRVEGDEAVAEVADRGPGLPASELERVFEPFYRAEPSRNRDTGGVGLGLSVARSIARAHGGELILVRGEVGLIARVRLPLASASRAT